MIMLRKIGTSMTIILKAVLELIVIDSPQDNDDNLFVLFGCLFKATSSNFGHEF